MKAKRTVPVPDDYRPPIACEFEAEVSIHSFTGSGGGFTVRIEDSQSGACMGATLTPEAFARCIGGQGHIEAEGSARRVGLLGTRREHKLERVPSAGYAGLSDAPRSDSEQADLAPFEVDGWWARHSDLRNRHRDNGDGTYNVHFYRDVIDVEEGEDSDV